jgi:hypothetical protein
MHACIPDCIVVVVTAARVEIGRRRRRCLGRLMGQMTFSRVPRMCATPTDRISPRIIWRMQFAQNMNQYYSPQVAYVTYNSYKLYAVNFSKF